MGRMRELFNEWLTLFNTNIHTIQTNNKGYLIIDTSHAETLTEQHLRATLEFDKIELDKTLENLAEVIEIYKECLETSKRVEMALIEDPPSPHPDNIEYVNKRKKSKERNKKIIKYLENKLSEYNSEKGQLENILQGDKNISMIEDLLIIQNKLKERDPDIRLLLKLYIFWCKEKNIDPNKQLYSEYHGYDQDINVPSYRLFNFLDLQYNDLINPYPGKLIENTLGNHPEILSKAKKIEYEFRDALPDFVTNPLTDLRVDLTSDLIQQYIELRKEVDDNSSKYGTISLGMFPEEIFLPLSKLRIKSIMFKIETQLFQTINTTIQIYQETQDTDLLSNKYLQFNMGSFLEKFPDALFINILAEEGKKTEWTYFEFKSDLDPKKKEEISELIASMANTESGLLVFGWDEKTKSFVDVDVELIEQKIVNWNRDVIKPPLQLYFRKILVEGKLILIVLIPAEINLRSVKSKILIRVGSHKSDISGTNLNTHVLSRQNMIVGHLYLKYLDRYLSIPESETIKYKGEGFEITKKKLELFKGWIKEKNPNCTIEPYLENDQYIIKTKHYAKIRYDIITEKQPAADIGNRFISYQMQINSSDYNRHYNEANLVILVNSSIIPEEMEIYIKQQIKFGYVGYGIKIFFASIIEGEFKILSSYPNKNANSTKV